MRNFASTRRHTPTPACGDGSCDASCRARAGFPSPSRIVWRGTYEDTYHLPVTEVDEAGNETRYRYDLDDGTPVPTGRLTEIEFADGAVQRFEYDGRGRLIASTTPGGARAEIAYGALGPARGLVEQVVHDVHDLALIERFEYDEAGNIVTVTEPDGSSSGLFLRRLRPVDGAPQLSASRRRDQPAPRSRRPGDGCPPATWRARRPDARGRSDRGRVPARRAGQRCCRNALVEHRRAALDTPDRGLAGSQSRRATMAGRRCASASTSAGF